ncbi:hypothetical protein GCM10023096_76670 [Nonomuraea ferruginea]
MAGHDQALEGGFARLVRVDVEHSPAGVLKVVEEADVVHMSLRVDVRESHHSEKDVPLRQGVFDHEATVPVRRQDPDRAYHF